jgi:hypothetical protein|tara:strand:- start:285 stop:623 length:339 start_codon:yes stop_codon:yes gene_type:complete
VNDNDVNDVTDYDCRWLVCVIRKGQYQGGQLLKRAILVLSRYGPFWSVLGLFGPSGTVSDCFGAFRSILQLNGLFQSVSNRFEAFWANLSRFEQFWAISGCFGLSIIVLEPF